MKLILSYIFYLFGHVISILLRYNLFAFLYPLYTRCMLMSSDLDVNEKIWKNP